MATYVRSSAKWVSLSLKRAVISVASGNHCFDLETGHRCDIAVENHIWKPGVLPSPFAYTRKLLLVIQKLDGIELNHVANKRRQLGDDLRKVHGSVR